MLNRGQEKIAFQRAASVVAEEPFGVGLGDFNGDDLLDLITASGESAALVELFWGNGRGQFEPAAGAPFSLARGGKNLAVGDFNGDGFDDAVVVSYQSSDILLLLGGTAAMTVSTLPGGEHPWGLAVSDFNGDGRDDLIVVDDASHTARIFLTDKPLR